MFFVPFLLSGCWQNKCSKDLQKLISTSIVHCPIDNNYYWNTSFYEKTKIIDVCSKPLFDVISNKNYNCEEVKLIEKYKQCMDITYAMDYNDYYLEQSSCVSNILDWFTKIIKEKTK